MADLPEPNFVDRDGAAILADWISRYEALIGRPLLPTQVERLLLDVGAYRETLVRVAIQEAGKQNLVRYARYPMLDLIVELLGGARLGAVAAITTLRFTLPAALGTLTSIPQGTRVRTKDKKIIFASAKDCSIAVGQTTVDVMMSADLAGPIGNGYGPGQVSEILDDLGVTISAANLSTTSGGTPAEDSDRLRQRIPDILAEYAVAGPEDAYRAHAIAAHPDVQDAWIESYDPDREGSPEPGIARVHVLATYGVPTEDLLDVVDAALSSTTVRPICDTVEVVAAEEIEYSIVATLDLRSGSATDDTIAAAGAAAGDFADERAERLGRSIVRTQVVNELSRPKVVLDDAGVPTVLRPELASVYRVNLTTPGADLSLEPNQFGRCTSITITLGELVEEG